MSKNRLNPYPKHSFQSLWWERGYNSSDGVCFASETNFEAISCWEEGYEARKDICTTKQPSYNLHNQPAHTKIPIEVDMSDSFKMLMKNGLTNFEV